WLSVSPKNGEVATSGKLDLTLHFDTTTLKDSTYAADIILESNDPDQPKLTVPVNLTVGGYPVVITDVRKSNPTSQSITVGWKTDIVADGRIHYGLTPDAVNLVAEDSRGDIFSGTVHAVPIKSLTGNTLYYYKIESAGNLIHRDALDNPLTFKTAQEVISAPGLNVTGLVHSAAGTKVDGAHLYVQVARGSENPNDLEVVTSQALSMLTTIQNSEISYSLNLGNLKDSGGQPWILKKFDAILVHAQGGDKGFASRKDQTVLDPSATYQDLGVLQLKTTLNVQLSLPRGFSIRSTPGVPAKTLTSAEFLTNIPAQQVSRWLRDAKQFESSVMVENRIFGTFPIELGDAYFIKVDTLRSYNFDVFSLGDSVLQTNLKSGLNIISTPIGRTYTSYTLISGITSATEAVRWRTKTQAYESAFTIGQGVIIGENFTIENGKGYFVRVTNDVTWSITGDVASPAQFTAKRLRPSERLTYLSDYPATPLTRVNGSNVSPTGNRVTLTNLTPVS
ncbi:MAG TPA: hypothetical protein DIT99_22265, partial [Candidatus Latescibacteria bacterium]|nr:hypothetical protein [Candidatus Latescibacterota bacterium]